MKPCEMKLNKIYAVTYQWHSGPLTVYLQPVTTGQSLENIYAKYIGTLTEQCFSYDENCPIYRNPLDNKPDIKIREATDEEITIAMINMNKNAQIKRG